MNSKIEKFGKWAGAATLLTCLGVAIFILMEIMCIVLYRPVETRLWHAAISGSLVGLFHFATYFAEYRVEAVSGRKFPLVLVGASISAFVVVFFVWSPRI